MIVSILIRVHGDQPFLTLAINSVLEQITNFEFDIWLILDRPSAEVISDLKSMSDHRIKKFYPKSKGFSGPIGELLVQISSEYVAILDADDAMNQNRLQLQHDFLVQNPNLAVLGSGIILIDENGTAIGKKSYSTKSSELCKNRFKNLPVAHPSVMFRRKFILKAGSYRSFYDYAEDYDLWLRVFEVADIGNLEDYLTNYRIHNEQTNSERIKENVLAGVAARKSAHRRLKGKRDYSDKYKNVQELMKLPTVYIEVHWRTFERKLQKRLSQSRKASKYIDVLFCFMLLAFIHPRNLITKIQNSRYE